jgi:hypothetical protein
MLPADYRREWQAPSEMIGEAEGSENITAFLIIEFFVRNI